MNYNVHLIGSLSAGVTAACLLPNTNMMTKGIIIGASAIGGMLPDTDCPTSKPAKILLPISIIVRVLNETLLITGSVESLANKKKGKEIKSLSHHRGIMHTIFLPLLFVLLAYIFRNNIYAFTIFEGIIVGIISHLFLDSLNPMGLRLFEPILRLKIRLLKLNGENRFHQFIAVVINTIVLVIIIYLVNPNFFNSIIHKF